MARRPIGLDIGSTAVRAVELSNGGGPPTLLRMAQLPLPPGTVSNGEIRDPGQVTEVLRELWRIGRFRSRHVHLGVGNQRVVVREVVLPWLDDKEFRQALPFQVRESVPIPIEDAVLDYQVLEELEQEGRRMVRILLAAAQKVMVTRVLEAVAGAKIKATALDLVPFATVRSTGTEQGWRLDRDEAPSDEVVVDIGAEVASICVHSRGRPRFVRMLPWGGRMVTSALAAALDVPESEAERIKRGGGAAAGREVLERAEEVVRATCSTFADDVWSSLEFYRSQVPDARIGQVLLVGGGSKLPVLRRLLDERIPIHVLSGRPLHRIVVPQDLPPHVVAEAEPLLSVAVGLALPGGDE